MIRKLLMMLTILLLSAGPAFASEVGVVLLHGKWGSHKPKSPIGKLAAKLKSAGFMVELPSQAWSKNRYLDRDYEAAMDDIDKAVEKLKSNGATKIVVGGQSMGANAALGYGARRDGLAGVMALAPGHIPDNDAFQNKIDNDYKRALDAISAGNGKKEDKYKDVNQGKKSSFTMTANIYASWFDPNGPANMPKNAAILKPGTALLWAVGTKDSMFERGEAYAFANAPANPNNTYAVIDGASHRNTPIKSAGVIIKWLKGL